MLWLFFVVLNTLGDGLGTYLVAMLEVLKSEIMNGNDIYQAASTSRRLRKRIKACRIYSKYGNVNRYLPQTTCLYDLPKQHHL